MTEDDPCRRFFSTDRHTALRAIPTIRCLAPACGPAWWGLANLKTERFTPAELARLEALQRADPAPDPMDRIAAGFALGKALEDEERYADALEALTAANRIAFEGWQALIRRQSEILQEAMKQAVADASQQDALQKRAELAKDRFEGALNNMRELAEMATKSQKDAFDVVRKRVEENMETFRNFGKKSD